MEQEFPGFLSDPLQLRCSLHGIKQLEGISPNSRLPVTPSLLRRFHCLLHLAHYDNTMLWPAILGTFSDFLWSSELNTEDNKIVLQRLEEYHGPPPAWSHSQTDPSGDNALHCTELPAGCVSLKTSGSFCFENRTLLQYSLALEHPDQGACRPHRSLLSAALISLFRIRNEEYKSSAEVQQLSPAIHPSPRH